MMKNRKIFLLFSFIFLFFLLLASKLVLASDSLGIEVVDGPINLEATDPRTIIVKIINIILGFLGIIAVSLAIFGGFLWMTSEGNEEKVSKAKRVLKNALIGLIIVLAAWGIVTFIFRSLFPDGQSGPGNISPSQSFFQNGLGAIGVCGLESVYPEPRQKAVPRNTMIMATFKEEVSSSTVSTDSVIICEETNFNTKDKTCSEQVSFSVNTIDNKIFTFMPNTYLGNENGFTNYIVYFNNEIKIAGENEKRSVFKNCSGNYFLWDFEVSNLLDLTPPQINNIFPQPDNGKDSLISTPATFATSSLNFLSQPNYAQPASSISVTGVSGNTAHLDLEVWPFYNGAYTNFSAVIDSSSPPKAQLFGKVPGGNDVSLGIVDIVGGSAGFDYYLTLKPQTIIAGNSWNIEVKKYISADNVIVGGFAYYFVSVPGTNYNVQVGSDVFETAENLRKAVNDSAYSNPFVEALSSPSGSSVVNLKIKTAGSSGNLYALSSSNSSAISITPFSGGNNKTETVQLGDKKDKPMNTIIQVNFNEAINPLMVSGESNEVGNTIRIVNNNSSAKSNGETCSQSTDCRSLNCSASSCVGDFLPGRFQISSDYKTVEFKSNNLCGVNACGEDIYCLPANSNLKVEIKTASLFNCSGNPSNCSNKNPFSACTNNICTDSNGKFYPLANTSSGIGVVDASFNSFDGNSNGYSDGPDSYYYKNASPASGGDNLSWSFWINDRIESDPPQIISISPGIDATSTDLWLPVKIGFNKLMMASTLRTGEDVINNGNEDVIHRLMNLLSGQLVGYWIGAENIDSDPLDGEPDKTNAYINHAQFFEGASYFPQIGSGVKDIYQNCFKPSVGLDCTASAVAPYCCNGVATSTPCN